MSLPPRKNFWDDSETSAADLQKRTENVQRVLENLIQHALAGKPLDALIVAQWHKDCFSGLSYVTNHQLLGAYRGTEPPPELKTMGVRVGGVEGVPPLRVHQALGSFFRKLKEQLGSLAIRVPFEKDKSKVDVRRVAELAGWAHGEWVRIHPFANGNGRTARFIANWVLVRFRLLPVVGIRPRPDHPYGPVAAASMRGDHSPMADYIVGLIEKVTSR